MVLYLNRERLRLVKKNDKGRVLKRRKYVFGDEVDPEFFDSEEQEGRLALLVEKGTLVESKYDLDRYAGFKHRAGYSASQARGQSTTVTGGQTGAATGPSAAHEGVGDDANGGTGDDYPTYSDKPRPEGWENFSDAEKRAYVYGTGSTLTPEPNHLEEPQGGGAKTSKAEDDGPKTEDGDDVEMVDAFAEMDHGELQDAARSAGLRFVGVSTEDLRDSLRANAKSDES